MIKLVFRKIQRFRVIALSAISMAAIVLFLRWVYITNDQSTMLLWLAIILAALTAIVNTLSLDKTRQALDLTKESLELNMRSTRAFLSLTDVRYSPGEHSGNPRILLNLRNTGLLPAHNVIIEMEVSTMELDQSFITVPEKMSAKQRQALASLKVRLGNKLFVRNGAQGPQQRIEQPTLKPDESREIVFDAPPQIRDMTTTENTHLIIRTEFSPDIVRTSSYHFYHTERRYLLPPHIKTLDESFDFIFRSGGEFD